MKALGLVVAAGRGRRMGGGGGKLLLPLRGTPLLVHTLRALRKCESLDALCVVCREEDKSYLAEELFPKHGIEHVEGLVAGGEERKDSVRNGLLWAAERGRWDLVAIHDGARPLIDADVVDRCVESACQCGSGVAAVPVIDTIKAADGEGWVRETLDRTVLWSVQTPQAFSLSAVLSCYERGEKDGVTLSDDAQLLERMGKSVKLVMGSYENIKVTTPADLEVVGALLAKRERTALG